MNEICYDLHIHSCLSPCADNDMTPANIAGMAFLNGLGIAALTDHNTCANCPAFFEACRAVGVVPVAGMELETAEEIHLVCLFEQLHEALAFSAEVEKHRMAIPNKPEIFGDQLIMNAEDEVIGHEKNLLITATDLSLSAATDAVRASGGVVFPAHIDRQANGIIAILGDFPPDYRFSAAEFRDRENVEAYQTKYSGTRQLRLVTDSDAHHLWDISESGNVLALLDDGMAANGVRSAEEEHLIRHRLLAYLSGGGTYL